MAFNNPDRHDGAAPSSIYLLFFLLRLVARLAFKTVQATFAIPVIHVLLNLKLYWNARIHVCKTSNKKSPLVFQRGQECSSVEAVRLECSIDGKARGIKSKQQENNPNKGAKVHQISQLKYTTQSILYIQTFHLKYKRGF